MSQENVEVVKRAVAAVNDRDIDSYLACCTADVRMENANAPIEGAYGGSLITAAAATTSQNSVDQSSNTRAPMQTSPRNKSNLSPRRGDGGLRAACFPLYAGTPGARLELATYWLTASRSAN